MKKGMFTGWKDVYRFTFVQNLKIKAFKTALIGIGILMFVIFCAIPLIGGYSDSKKNNKKSENNPSVEKIYILNETDTENLDYSEFSDYYKYSKKANIEILNSESDIETVLQNAVNDNEKSFVVKIYPDENGKNKNFFEIFMPKNMKKSNAIEKDADNIAEYYNIVMEKNLGMTKESIDLVSSDIEVEKTDIKDADESMGELIAKIFVPMLCTLIIYMLVIMYGQSISKIIIVEKSSKLMETLLISVKPYAIVFGKIMAMFSVALVQIFTWLTLSLSGYFIGDKVAGSLFDNYNNPINNVVNLLKGGKGSAFSPIAIVIGIFALMLGFFMYCVLAGLITSNITKAEELSNGLSVYQMVVVVGFLASYMIPLVKSDSIITVLLRYIPITAAFMLPSDVILGNIGIAGSILSLVFLMLTTFGMVILTGKIYKKKVF